MEQSMKKIKVSILFILLLFLTGCSNEYGLNKKNPVSISIWHYYNGAQQQQFDNLVDEFNKTVGIEKGIIMQSYAQGTVNDIQEKVLNAIDGKVGAEDIPEIFAAYADTAYEVTKLGMAADISQYVKEEELATYLDSYIAEGHFNDDKSLQLFPIAKSTELFIINKTDWDKFAEATGASDSAFATWEGIAKVSESYYHWTDSLTKEPDDGKAFFGRDAMANYLIIGSMQLGKELFEVHNGKVTYNIDKNIMRRLWDNYYIPYINGYYKSVGKFRSDDAKTGEIIATLGSSTSAAYFPETVTLEDETSYPIEAAVYPAPNFENTTPYAIQQGAGMVITKSNETKEYAASLFLKWFTEKEQNITFSISSGYLPVKNESNDIKLIDSIIESQNLEFKPLVRDSIETGVMMSKEYKFYTAKAFENAQEARKFITETLQQKADSDTAAIEQLMEQGMTKTEAVARFNTDENFDSWFKGLAANLE